MLARPRAWLHRVTARLDQVAFSPASLPDDLVTGIALAAPVAAGLIIFKVPAFEMLAVALSVGIVTHLVARWVWRHDVPRPKPGTVIAAVFGVALVGAGAPLAISVAVAALAVVLELLRARYVPAIRAQAGLIAFAAVTLITRSATSAYIQPVSGQPFSDPISIWNLQPSLPLSYDPITLYVGNVAGPVFATSLLAVAIGIAWLAYARRLSLVVAVGFLAGATVWIGAHHWDYFAHLDSGPTWFVAGLLLADRRNLPGSWAIRPILGFGAGLLAIGLRVKYGLDAAFLTVAGIQTAMAVVVVMLWAASIWTGRWQRNRRLRQRDAQLRVVETIPRAS